MLEALRNLSDRERILLAVSGALLAGVVLLYAIILPVLGFERRSAEAFVAASRLARMTENLEAGGEGSPDDRALRSVVTELADRRRIIYTRINTAPDGQLQLDLENAPYAAFFGWLADLEAEEDVIVTSAFVTPGDLPDTVEARLTLARAE